MDLNQHNTRYERRALPLSYRKKQKKTFMVELAGFEPTTSRVQNERSTYVELQPHNVSAGGIEPTIIWFSVKYSTIELRRILHLMGIEPMSLPWKGNVLTN